MPNTKSAKKALRQNTRRRERNVARKHAYREAVKAFRKLARGTQTHDTARQMLPNVYQTLDKAAKRNIITKNKARRLKSRLARKLSK
jgi:small subunit ribosomal protein S20